MDKATLLAPDDRNRLVDLAAARMGIDPAADHRAALLVYLAFAAADFAFQRWVGQSTRGQQPLQVCLSDALEAVTHPRWRRARDD